MLESREGTPVRVAEPPCEVVFVASMNVGFAARFCCSEKKEKGRNEFESRGRGRG